ncbi:type I-E CRISPR-associated protein Cse2/CasB [Rothia halotolerans]|uniref:type I-E CRISPR-associated protein Cse2/CasB n=1 Tax=Rothia halotolerans TaxID=405770 RepID=UPI00101B7D69|nr:type I-E CRISPR-associated protein Cse2/CasB [Rothia halotolerans]
MTEQQRSPELALIHEILRRREHESYRRARAEIRRGASPTTEHYAYPYVIPRLANPADGTSRTVLLRIAALAAEFTAVPPFSPRREISEAERPEGEHRKRSTPARKSLGRWAYELEAARSGGTPSLDPDRPGMVASRIAYLHTQDHEEAITAVRRLLQMASGLGARIPDMDYASLYWLFLRWGNGVSEASAQVRRRVLQDFYSGYAAAPEAAGTAEDPLDQSDPS